MRLYYKLVGHRIRTNYWSCSKFAAKVRRKLGVEEKPSAATLEGWSEWKKNNTNNFGYWLTEEAFDAAQDVVYFPIDVYRNIRRYINNRFVTKTHYIDTKLERGQWHEMDARILHGMMESLVGFVEIEKANMRYLSDEVPLWRDNTLKGKFVRWKTYHSRELPSRQKGLEYLDWEISLGEESPLQSAAARNIKELYLWWKDVRPARPDPMDASGWSEHCDARRDGGDIFCRPETPEEKDRVEQMLEEMRLLEQQYYDEDTEMLTRLIKIRDSLWT
jgi:hypothetical protein